jgi:cytochrome b
MDQSASRLPGPHPATRPVAVRAGGVRVWDLPTRLFHWLLLASVTGAVATAQIGGNLMDWHFRFGACTLGLLAFRLAWGFIGPRYARFSSFVYTPRVVLRSLRQLRNEKTRHAGHSPSGALSVFALLGILLTQVLSGLFSSDSIGTDGPMTRYASEATVNWATWVHHTVQWMIYGLVALHVAAVMAYLLVKKDNLIRSMLDGDKHGLSAPEASDTRVVRVAGLMLMVLCISLSLWLFRP